MKCVFLPFKPQQNCQLSQLSLACAKIQFAFLILISHGLVDCDLKYIMCFRAVTVATVVGFLRLSDPYFCNTFSASCDSCLRHCDARLGTPRLTSKPRLAGLIEGGWAKNQGVGEVGDDVRGISAPTTAACASLTRRKPCGGTLRGRDSAWPHRTDAQNSGSERNVNSANILRIRHAIRVVVPNLFRCGTGFLPLTISASPGNSRTGHSDWRRSPPRILIGT